MNLSIVATLYASESYINEFVDRASIVAEKVSHNDFEIILVDDGSLDNSLELAVELTAKHDWLKVIELSRNFGHHKAMMTGLSHASGDLVYLLDSDLEESPEWLFDFLNEMEVTSSDVVYGVQKSRKGGLIERLSGELFYSFINRLTFYKLPKNIVTARVMTRDYVDALLEHKDKEVFLAGLWHITGFKQTAFTIDKLSTSETTYTFYRKASVLINSVTSFSSAPLHAIFYTGAAISIISMIYIVYLILRKLMFGSALSGWTSLMASVWLIGGLIILFLGVIGIYLAKVFSEVKDRPYTVVRKVHEKS